MFVFCSLLNNFELRVVQQNNTMTRILRIVFFGKIMFVYFSRFQHVAAFSRLCRNVQIGLELSGHLPDFF